MSAHAETHTAGAEAAGAHPKPETPAWTKWLEDKTGEIAGAVYDATDGIWEAGPGQVPGEAREIANKLGYKSKVKGFIAVPVHAAASIIKKSAETFIKAPAKGLYHLCIDMPVNMLRRAGNGLQKFVGGAKKFFGAFVPKRIKNFIAHQKEHAAHAAHAEHAAGAEHHDAGAGHAAPLH